MLKFNIDLGWINPGIFVLSYWLWPVGAVSAHVVSDHALMFALFLTLMKTKHLLCLVSELYLKWCFKTTRSDEEFLKHLVKHDLKQKQSCFVSHPWLFPRSGDSTVLRGQTPDGHDHCYSSSLREIQRWRLQVCPRSGKLHLLNFSFINSYILMRACMKEHLVLLIKN